MGKRSGESWFTIVKRAFRSPAKHNEKKSSTRMDEKEHDDQDKVRILTYIYIYIYSIS